MLPNFQNCSYCQDLKDNKHNSLHLARKYLSLDIISKLTVFFELRSRKTVRFSEQITSASGQIFEDIFEPNRGYCLLMLLSFVCFSLSSLAFAFCPFFSLSISLPLYLQKRQELDSIHKLPFCTDNPVQDVPQALPWSPVHHISNERTAL